MEPVSKWRNVRGHNPLVSEVVSCMKPQHSLLCCGMWGWGLHLRPLPPSEAKLKAEREEEEEEEHLNGVLSARVTKAWVVGTCPETGPTPRSKQMISAAPQMAARLSTSCLPCPISF